MKNRPTNLRDSFKTDEQKYQEKYAKEAFLFAAVSIVGTVVCAFIVWVTWIG